MLIAQLSDFHFSRTPLLGGRVNTADMAARAIDAVLNLATPPDAVILTGDLAEHGSADDYEGLRTQLSRLPMPVLAVPGNHDRREAFRRGWSRCGTDDGRALHVSKQIGAVRLIGLDTLVDGSSHGRLDADGLSFLSDALAEAPQATTIVFMHHPPAACGIPAMDRIRLLEGAAELEQILLRNTQVVRLLCGHVHRSIQMQFGGTICAVAPAVAHQVAPDFNDAGVIRVTGEPPGFLLHWVDGRQVASHLLHVAGTEIIDA